MDWRFGIGNLARRAARAPVAVAPAVADSLVNLADDFPDTLGGLEWRSDGTYDIDFDLNLLAETSSRADAPTGWADLLNFLAGSPGLPANPPDWATYATRTALRLFRPVFQDVDVMPGEDLKFPGGIYLPLASSATGVEVRVIDLTTGNQYDAVAVGWDADGQIEEQQVTDTWKDFSVAIPADTTHTERRIYRIVVSPQAATFDATSYVYLSANGGTGTSPALFADVDLAAIVGHNIPDGATVELQPQPSGTAIALTVAKPSMYAVAISAQSIQTWRLSIDIPAALRPSAPRPMMGEVWIGGVRTLLGKAPVLPISISEGDPNQVRIETLGGRVEVLGTGVPPRASMLLNFTFDTASYQQARDQVARLTRNGEEALLLLTSDSFEGAGKLYHGKLGSDVAYSRTTPGDVDALRSFGWAFEESPHAAQ